MPYDRSEGRFRTATLSLGQSGTGRPNMEAPQLAAMPPPSKVIGDQPLPREIFREGVEGLGCLDINWLNSNAIRRAGSTWQRYEFRGISCHRDSVLALWPVPMHGTTQPATAFTEETATEFVRRWLDNNRERPSLVKCEKDALATGKGGRDFIRVAFRIIGPQTWDQPEQEGTKGTTQIIRRRLHQKICVTSKRLIGQRKKLCR